MYIVQYNEVPRTSRQGCRVHTLTNQQGPLHGTGSCGLYTGGALAHVHCPLETYHHPEPLRPEVSYQYNHIHRIKIIYDNILYGRCYSI